MCVCEHTMWWAVYQSAASTCTGIFLVCSDVSGTLFAVSVNVLLLSSVVLNWKLVLEKPGCCTPPTPPLTQPGVIYRMKGVWWVKPRDCCSGCCCANRTMLLFVLMLRSMNWRRPMACCTSPWGGLLRATDPQYSPTMTSDWTVSKHLSQEL